MFREIWSGFALFMLLSAITGGLYPLVVTVVAQKAFPEQSRGSFVKIDGNFVGSKLIGQAFTQKGYFWSRPSATSPEYNAGASSGSNLGPTNPVLIEAVTERAKNLQGTNTAPLPVDLVTTSASGLDPHITPAAAIFQIPRVAKARNLSEDEVRQLVDRSVESRTIGIFGEPRVNVLMLNLELDRQTSGK